MKIISTGEVLWDVFDHREILGGAPLNFSASLQRLGHSVSLVTGVGNDKRGDGILERMKELGLSTEFVQRIPGRETGIARVTLDAGGSASFVIPRPAAFDSLNVDDQLFSSIAALHGDWIYFGTLSNVSQSNLDLLNEILRDTPSIKGFYDMNLREGHWHLALVEQLAHLATVLKLNDVESEILFRLLYPTERYSLESFCSRWAARFDIQTICVTLGSKGCAVFTGDGADEDQATLRLFPGYRVEVADTVGAGDAFAAGFLHALSQPWQLDQKAAFANALGGLVASRAGATPDWTVEEVKKIIAQQQTTIASPTAPA